MHNQAVKKSNLVDSNTERNKVGSREYNNNIIKNNHPLCPKPQRLPSAKPEFLKPLRCTKHSQPNADEGSGVLHMITKKNSDVKESACIGCLPCCYSGSPPRRTENPMVRDVEFLHQMELVSPLILSDQFGFSSASPM